MLAGILRALEGLALLVDAPDRPLPASRPLRRSVADWLPALVNAGRAFVAIGMVELFWVVTAWPNGASMMVFVAILVLLLSPKGDLAYGGAIAFTLGTAGSVVCAAIIKFAVLPGLDSFPAFSAALGLVLIPVGFAMASSRRPAALALFSAMGVNFLPLLAPTNQMSYNTVQFYNSALAVFSGCAAAALSFGLLPPLSPAFRARRLLVLTLRDLRRLASDAFSPSTEEWEGRMYSRLAALPDSAEPLQRAQLLAALSIGNDILQLRHLPPVISLQPELDAALVALAQGKSNMARMRACPPGPQARLSRSRRAGSGPSSARQNPLAFRSPRPIWQLFRLWGAAMSFTDIDLFGVYVAPMSLMMIAAWLVTIALRQVADRFGLLRHVWHPALFVFAVFMIVLSSITLVVAR